MILPPPSRLSNPAILPVQIPRLVHHDSPINFSSNVILQQAFELGILLLKGEGVQHEGSPIPALAGVLMCGGWTSNQSVIPPEGVKIAPYGSLFSVSSRTWPWGSDLDVMAVDIGKSYLKCGFAGVTRRFARNFDKFPIMKAKPRARLQFRREMARFVGLKLAAVMREANRRPQTLIVGLPCKVDSIGTPKEEAWPGLFGWDAAVSAFARAAELECVNLLVCNDAELAALSALEVSSIKHWNTFAVITIGSALGLALASRTGFENLKG